MNNRRFKKNKQKQQAKATQIIEAFLEKYDRKIILVKAKAAERMATPEIKNEYYKDLLSEANTIFLQVWRGVVAYIRENLPFAQVNPNFFSSKIIWE